MQKVWFLWSLLFELYLTDDIKFDFDLANMLIEFLDWPLFIETTACESLRTDELTA